MNGWYPRLSRDARSLCSGNDEVWINGQLIERGYAPVWLDDQRVIWTRAVRDAQGASLPGDGIGLRVGYAGGGLPSDYDLDTGPINEKAAGARIWAVWSPATGIRWWGGARSPDGALPSISSDGHRAWVERWITVDKALMLDDADVWRGNVTSVRVSERGALAWTVAATSGPRTERSWVRLPNEPPRDVSLSNAEFAPLLVDTPRGWMLLAYQVGPNRLTLRPVGESRGWVVRVGRTRDPDARWESGRVRVVSCNRPGRAARRCRGSRRTRRYPLGDTPIDPPIDPPPIRPPIEPPIEPPPVRPPIVPPVTPEEPDMPLPPYDESWIVNVASPVFWDLYADAGRVFAEDPQSMVWIARNQYDICAGVVPAVSLARHAAECKTALGLKG